MKAYCDIVNKVFKYGELKVGRNGNTYSISGAEFRHDMAKGFPILTIREMNLSNAITELRFFIQGLTDKSWLQKRGNKFWDKWCNRLSNEFMDYVSANVPPMTAARLTNDLGPIYGSQWRDFNGIDQFKDVLRTLRDAPNSRRMLVSAWNPSKLDSMALPPCHDSFQFISNGTDLDLIWRQRSCDIAVGLPYDILLYGLLLTLVAIETNQKPRYLIGQLGDTHYYEVNEPKLRQVMAREPRILPELQLRFASDIANLGVIHWASKDNMADYTFTNYNPHPKVFFEVVE